MRHRNLFQSHSKGATASDHVGLSSNDVFKKNNATHRRNEKFWQEKEALLFQTIGNCGSKWFLFKTPSRIQLLLVDLWFMEQGLVWLSDFFSSESLGHCLFTWPGQGYCEPSRHLKENYMLSFFLHPPCPKAVTLRQLLAQPWICNYSCCHKNTPQREAYSIGRNSHTQKKDASTGVMIELDCLEQENCTLNVAGSVLSLLPSCLKDS